jgi:hypothetical protein
MRLVLSCILLLICCAAESAGETWRGFQGAEWGMSPQQVQQAAQIEGWQQVEDNGFPAELNIRVYEAGQQVAGYDASTRYYFFEGRFFQATVAFDFDHLKTFDFNYNVFISVDRYYRAIHDETVVFVQDIYDLLRKKYGKKQPVFKGLDPRHIFVRTNAYLQQERWNLRYHPSEYYKRIVTAAYARWDFPKTRVLFSINISAADKRFDYLLSLTSLDLEKEINQRKDELRTRDL